MNQKVAVIRRTIAEGACKCVWWEDDRCKLAGSSDCPDSQAGCWCWAQATEIDAALGTASKTIGDVEATGCSLYDPRMPNKMLVCVDCGLVTARSGPRQKRCSDCAKKAGRLRVLTWKRNAKATAPPAAWKAGRCDICALAYVRRSGTSKFCDDCRPSATKEGQRAWNLAFRMNPGRQAKYAAQRKLHYRANAQAIQARAKLKPVDREQARLRHRRWTELNRDHVIRKRKEAYLRKIAQPKWRLHGRIRESIRTSLKGGKHGRRWEDLVGYSLSDLMAHLERQFTRGMSWNNIQAWHIEHIRPVAMFSFSDPGDQEFEDCWALSNLRPMWAKENLQKGAKRTLLL